MNSQTILALDLGSHRTGWAFGLAGAVKGTGVWRLVGKQARFEGAGMRYVRLRLLLEEIIGAVKPHRVVYEEVRRHLGVDAAHAYGASLGVLQSVCEVLGVPYMAVPVAAIKRCATGKGNASKKEMTEAFEGATGKKPETDDEDDAYWLCVHALGE